MRLKTLLVKQTEMDLPFWDLTDSGHMLLFPVEKIVAKTLNAEITAFVEERKEHSGKKYKVAVIQIDSKELEYEDYWSEGLYNQIFRYNELQLYLGFQFSRDVMMDDGDYELESYEHYSGLKPVIVVYELNKYLIIHDLREIQIEAEGFPLVEDKLSNFNSVKEFVYNNKYSWS